MSLQSRLAELISMIGTDVKEIKSAAGSYVPIVTALPTTGPGPLNALVNGQECYYLADAAAGVTWHLKYRSAETGPYKWYFVGGSDMSTADVGSADQATSSTSYTDLTTTGPSLTVPLAGDYEVYMQARGYGSTVGMALFMSFAVGATAAIDGDSISVAVASAGSDVNNLSGWKKKTGLSAGVVLTCKYRVGANTGTFRGTNSGSGRRLRIRPVRVG